MATIDPWNPDARKARIKAIKTLVGPKGLALDDGTYRQMLGNVVAGKSSLTECSVAQLDKVLGHVKRLACQPTDPSTADEWRFVFRCIPERQIHLRKIYRLAERCGALLSPSVPIAPKGWVEGTARQMVGCNTLLEFCGPELLHKIVQALEIHCKRSGV